MGDDIFGQNPVMVRAHENVYGDNILVQVAGCVADSP